MAKLTKKIIYDLGANNGDDIPYYVLKADLVIAVEANPALCQLMRTRFAEHIRAGRLVVESCVVTAAPVDGYTDFYIHKADHVRSQLTAPVPSKQASYERIALPSKTVTEIVATYGTPFYVKVDIEHCDAEILRALFNANIFPPFISAESHSIEVFALLVAQGRYNAFKLVDGRSVSTVYSNRLITSADQEHQVRYSFPAHSAGPFGNDVDGEWMTADGFYRVLALEGLGWKDVHATNVEVATAARSMSVRRHFLRYIARAGRSKAKVLLSKLMREHRVSLL